MKLQLYSEVLSGQVGFTVIAVSLVALVEIVGPFAIISPMTVFPVTVIMDVFVLFAPSVLVTVSSTANFILE
jgi:hypothetical protein